MNRKGLTLLFSIWIIVLLVACDSFTGTPPTETPDIQATVDAAIAATATAQVEEGIPDEYAEMSEEELALLITAYAEESLETSEEASEAVEKAANDGTITMEEAEELENYVSDTEEAIAVTEEAIYAYYWLYGELAEETLYLLGLVEEDMDELAAITLEMVQLLIEVENALDAGLEVAIETINGLESAAEEIQNQADDWQNKGNTWVDALQGEIENRAIWIADIQPSEIAGNRREAILSTFSYIDAIRGALDDEKLTSLELSNIAQLSANAVAGLNAQGGPKLQDLTGDIGGITTQLASGQISAARGGLSALEGAIGTRP